MIGKLRNFEDHVSTLDDKLDRTWSDPTMIAAPIDLARYGPNAVLFLKADALKLGESEKTRWLASLGAFILRGGEVRWTVR